MWAGNLVCGAAVIGGLELSPVLLGALPLLVLVVALGYRSALTAVQVVRGAVALSDRRGKREERLSWVLSGALLLIILLNLATSYGMNLWNREVFDALEKRDAEAVLFLSMLYFPLLVASVSLSVMQVYARMTTQRRWRAWLIQCPAV